MNGKLIVNEKEYEVEVSDSGYLIVGNYPAIDYVMGYNIHKNEYVCAWNYNWETHTWGQGHYFETLVDACDYMHTKLTNEIKNNINIDEE